MVFLALRENYRGECLELEWNPLSRTNYDTKQFLFLTSLGIVFLLSFLCFGAALVGLATRVVHPSTNLAMALSGGLLVASLIYASLALVTWTRDPIPWNTEDNKRLYLSVLWPIGLLQETGNYSPTLCGE